MSRFFIDRPVFAWVIAIVIMLAGALAIATLPVAQYPAIAPPTISITARYPGASAKTLEEGVTQVIEQRMNGLDGFVYMSSSSDASGTATITLTFDPSVDPDIAQVQVQNKLQLATPLLPQEVQRQGVQVSKARSTFLMVVAIVSSDGRLTAADLSDLERLEPAGSARPRSRSRQRDALRRAVRDADLARSAEAGELLADPRRCARRDPGTERAGLGRAAGCGAGGARPAAECHGQCAKPPAAARAVRSDRAAQREQRRHRAPARCRARGAGERELRHDRALQRQAGVGHGDSARHRRQCARHRRPRPRGARGAEEPVSPGRAGRHRVRHHAIREPLHRGSDQDTRRSHRPGVHRHVGVPAERSRNTDHHPHGAGGAARHVRRCLRHLASASTR